MTSGELLDLKNRACAAERLGFHQRQHAPPSAQIHCRFPQLVIVSIWAELADFSGCEEKSGRFELLSRL
jgi:hypothetical protein